MVCHGNQFHEILLCQQYQMDENAQCSLVTTKCLFIYDIDQTMHKTLQKIWN